MTKIKKKINNNIVTFPKKTNSIEKFNNDQEDKLSSIHNAIESGQSLKEISDE